MVDLKQIWHDQKLFNKNFVKYDEVTDEERQKITKEYCLQLQGEIHELLREINFKTHRGNRKVIYSNLKEEWIDIFKYWLSIGILWDWEPEHFNSEYFRKSAVCEQRYKQELELNLLEDINCIAVDIDGVLGDYPIAFQNFIKEQTGVWIDITTYDLYEEYAKVLSWDKMIALKHEYRDTGQKRYIPICDGAKDFLDRQKQAGKTIILLTSRPYKQYSRIFADTMEWLKDGELQYDAIIWDEDKNYSVIKDFPNIDYMVEDNPKFAINIANLGYKVYLVDKIYNQNCQHENITRIKSLKEIK
jgi:uncharacterized HAD superfamily protein